MSRAAFLADYVDLAFRKTRKVAIVTLEIPIERANEFVAAFGTPNQATGVPVAIARIDPTKAASAPAISDDASPKERRKWNVLPPAQQAAMLCSKEAFQRYVSEEHTGTKPDEEATVKFVRDFCGVESRSEIRVGTPAAFKWATLDNSYLAWLNT